MSDPLLNPTTYPSLTEKKQILHLKSTGMTYQQIAEVCHITYHQVTRIYHTALFRIHEWECYNALKERNNEAAEVSFTCGEMKRIPRGLYLLERDMQRCTRIHAEDWRGILSMNTRL